MNHVWSKRCLVTRCKRSGRVFTFCDQHWRMVPARMKQAIDRTRARFEIGIARVHVEIAEREDDRAEKAGL